MTAEKNKLHEKAYEIVNEIKRTDNIFLPKNKKLKSKLIAELKRIVPIDTQEKVKKTLNRPILFVGDVCKSMLAGCYAHCVRKVEFTLTLLPKRLDELSIKHFGNPVENFEMVRQITKDLSEIEGEFIFKDCFGQPLEKLWYGDDPDYCHADILDPNGNVYTQNTGIKNWLKDYRLGKTLFLVCLEGKDSNECKEFVKNIREMSYPKPGIPNKLIVHTNDINKLPGYFLEPFEEIPLELEKQDISASIPQGKKTRIYFCYNKKDRLVLFFKKDKSITLTENETKFFLFLKEDRRTPEEIIGHIWEVYKPKDLHNNRRNVMELRGRINNKYSKIGVEALISKLINGCYSLTIEAVER